MEAASQARSLLVDATKTLTGDKATACQEAIDILDARVLEGK